MKNNSKSDYWIRKKQEIKFLANNCNYILDDDKFYNSVEQIVQEKLKIKSKMLANFFIDNWKISESNWMNFEHYSAQNMATNYQLATLRYSYQRFNLRLENNDFYSHIYGISNLIPYFSRIFFVSSGMSAISITLSALQKITSGYPLKLLLSKDSYFETIKYIDDYCPNLKAIESNGENLLRDSILYLDSISAKNQFSSFRSQSFSNLLAVLFDSTCYETDSSFVKAIVSKCLDEQTCCILLRSHIKLDCLALEYARLGSIVFILPTLLKRSALEFHKSLLFQITDLIAKTGTNFAPHALFPLSNLKEFYTLNKTRLFWLRQNNYHAARQIKKKMEANSYFQVREYHHGLFFTIETPAKSLQELKKYIQTYQILLEESGIYVKLAPSFGFDFISLDNYIDMISKQLVIRVAVSDYCKEDIQKFIKVTFSWLNGL